MTFRNRHRMSLAPKAQPKPVFYDENQRHGFNCHVTQCPHVLWHGRWHGHWRGQRGWCGTDMADDVVLTWKVMMTWPTWLLTCISAHKFLSPSKRPIKFQPAQTISPFIIAIFQPKWHSKFSAHLSELHILGPVYHNLNKQKIQHLRLHSEAHHNSWLHLFSEISVEVRLTHTPLLAATIFYRNVPSFGLWWSVSRILPSLLQPANKFILIIS